MSKPYPSWGKFLATEPSGAIYVYSSRPEWGDTGWFPKPGALCEKVDEGVGKNPNWRHSLLELPGEKPIPTVPADSRYNSLRLVLQRAYNQAACGKGAERHGQDLPFEDQPMQTISKMLNTDRGMLYQAVKKIQESTRMETGAAVRELLGAINYLAGTIIYLEGKKEQ